MALDTNVKSFKYSKANKIICVILCIVTFFSSMLLGITSILVNTYNENCFDKGISDNYMDSSEFQLSFRSDIYEVVNDVCAFAINAQIRKELNAKKEEVVEQAYNEYKRIESYIRADNEPTYDENTGDYAIMPRYYDEYDQVQCINVMIDDYSYSFDLSNYEVYRYSLTYPDNVRDYISREYDSFVENEGYRHDEHYYYNGSKRYANSLILYALFDEEYVTNGKYAQSSDAIEYAKSMNTYLVYQNGKLESKGIPDKIIDGIRDEIINESEITKKVTLAASFFDFPTAVESVTDFRYWNDYYITLANFNAFANTVGSSLSIIIAAVVLLVISFIAGFTYFSISGKISADDKSKLVWIDKIPVEIHFILTLGIGVGAVLLWLLSIEGLSTEFSIALIIWGSAGITVLQCLLLEMCSSFARIHNCEEGAKEHSLAVKLGRAIKKSFNVTKENLSYKPGAMNKNALRLIIAYFICNLIMIAVICLLFITYEFVFVLLGILLLIADVAVNAIIVAKLLAYVRNLDKIITAFSNKEDPAIGTGTLPKSLATLAMSMKYTNEELNAAVQKAVKDERLRSELITNVSHDLKTPLTSIITYVDLLSKCNIDDENAKSYIKVLDDKGARLKRLIEDLIEASKVTSGNVSVNITSINLAELCLQSTVDAQSDFEKADLQLIVKNTETPLIVNADGVKTFRVIENLLSNARKYSATSSRVYVEVYDTPNFGVFEIKNISAQPLDISADELTERFVRGDKSRNQEGNGLGLSIAKELCRLQNGTLELIIDGDLFKARVKLPKANS